MGNKSLGEANNEVLNHSAKLEHFPVGTLVKIVCLTQDFNFFYGETGIVTENNNDKDSLYPIRVKFDEPRHFDGWIQKDFNFHPTDLIPLKKNSAEVINASFKRGYEKGKEDMIKKMRKIIEK